MSASFLGVCDTDISNNYRDQFGPKCRSFDRAYPLTYLERMDSSDVQMGRRVYAVFNGVG